jgi:hypothetical protein
MPPEPAEHAGVPWTGFHTFRHTCATLLFRNGLNAKQVQMWLGHHSPAFTLATYVHLLPDDLPDPGFLDSLTMEAPEGGISRELTQLPKPLAADRVGHALNPPFRSSSKSVSTPEVALVPVTVRHLRLMLRRSGDATIQGAVGSPRLPRRDRVPSKQAAAVDERRARFCCSNCTLSELAGWRAAASTAVGPLSACRTGRHRSTADKQASSGPAVLGDLEAGAKSCRTDAAPDHRWLLDAGH